MCDFTFMTSMERISAMIKQQGKSQKQLTDYLGLNKTAFSDWKSGKSTSYKQYISEIARFLDTSTDFLLGNENTHAFDFKNFSEHIDFNCASTFIHSKFFDTYEQQGYTREEYIRKIGLNDDIGARIKDGGVLELNEVQVLSNVLDINASEFFKWYRVNGVKDERISRFEYESNPANNLLATSYICKYSKLSDDDKDIINKMIEALSAKENVDDLQYAASVNASTTSREAEGVAKQFSEYKGTK